MFELLGCEITRNARGISSCTRAERERRLDSKEPLSGLTLAHPFPRDSLCSQTENYMESLRAVRPPTSSLEMLLFMPYGFAPRLISLDTNFDWKEELARGLILEKKTLSIFSFQNAENAIFQGISFSLCSQASYRRISNVVRRDW